MREILFRGKRADDGEWTCGNLTVWSDGSTSIDIAEASPLYAVIPETVGQYIGLTDKNGKKIFEGDIVKREFTLWHGETKKTRETQIGVVVYSNRECCFQVEKKYYLRKPWDGDTIEVIGNIHDNPELLKGGE